MRWVGSGSPVPCRSRNNGPRKNSVLFELTALSTVSPNFTLKHIHRSDRWKFKTYLLPRQSTYCQKLKKMSTRYKNYRAGIIIVIYKQMSLEANGKWVCLLSMFLSCLSPGFCAAPAAVLAGSCSWVETTWCSSQQKHLLLCLLAGLGEYWAVVPLVVHLS